MEVVHPRCAGLDVSKRDVKVCVRIQGRGSRPTRATVTTWGSTTRQILALRDLLVAERVGMVVIESTGTYWKPFFYLLEDHLALSLVNAREAKTVPGRKTDVADAEWLADLGAHGLVRASLVPPPPIRELRDLTRARATIARDRAREVQRLEKLLEDAQIKLSSVVTDLCGVASRRILTAMMSGVTDPAALVLLRGGLKVSAADLTEALTGRFTEHHAFMTRLLLNRIDQHNATIQHLEQRIEQKINSLDAPRDLLTSIPGVSRTVADIIIAETGADMTAFPTAAHLCSWAGVSPGQHESAGRRKTAPTRPGNRHLKAALAPPPCQPPDSATPTCAPSTDASPPAAENSEPSSPSNEPSSPPSGTCSAPAPTTKTQDRTTTAATTPANTQPVPSAPFEPSATRSPFSPSPWPTKPTNSPVSYQREGQGFQPP
jgi:transposase